MLVFVLPCAAQGEAYRQDLFALSSEEMAGRATGTPGDEAAVAYLAAAMERIGLRPPCSGSFRQEFRVDNPAPATFLAETACVLEVGGERIGLAIGRDAAPFRFSADAEAGGPVVFAGHGLVVQEAGLDDYRGLSIEGRVVMVLRGGPRWREPDSPLREHRAHLTFRSKVQRAEERGARAVLIVDRDDGRAEIAPASVLRAQGAANLPVLWLSRDKAATLFRDGLRGLRAAQQILDGDAAESPGAALVPGSTVSLCVRMGRRPPDLGTANVIGVLRGSCAKLRGEHVVVGAHFDHLGRGEYGSLGGPDAVGRIHPGADDNASGTAGVLELARRLAQKAPPRRSVVFVAFGAEEFGQLGSRRFLDEGPIPPAAMAAMLDLNMIGRARSGTPTLHGVDSGTGLRELVQAHAAAGLTPQLRPWSSHRSDQSVFLSRGVPALLLTTGLHEDYHRPSDTPELVETEGALRLLDLAEALVRALADADARPEFRPFRK